MRRRRFPFRPDRRRPPCIRKHTLYTWCRANGCTPLSVADMDDRVRICSRAVRGKPWFVNKLMRRLPDGARGRGGLVEDVMRIETGGGVEGFEENRSSPLREHMARGIRVVKLLKTPIRRRGQRKKTKAWRRRGTHVPDGGTSEDGRAERRERVSGLFLQSSDVRDYGHRCWSGVPKWNKNNDNNNNNKFDKYNVRICARVEKIPTTWHVRGCTTRVYTVRTVYGPPAGRADDVFIVGRNKPGAASASLRTPPPPTQSSLRGFSKNSDDDHLRAFLPVLHWSGRRWRLRLFAVDPSEYSPKIIVLDGICPPPPGKKFWTKTRTRIFQNKIKWREKFQNLIKPI